MIAKNSSPKLSDLDLHFQDVLDALSSNIAILDGNGKIIAVNQAWRTFGQHNGLELPASGLGANYLDICDTAAKMAEETAAQVSSAIRQVHQGEIAEAIFEYPCHTPDHQRWFQVRISKFMLGKDYIIIIHDDITARKMAEESLRESEQKFRSIAEQSSEGISLIDPEGKIIEWNASEERITGLRKESVLGRYLWDVQMETSALPKNDAFKNQMKNMITGLLHTGKSSWINQPSEVEIVRPDGSHVHVSSLIFPIRFDHGFMACSITRDISDLTKTHQELKESESFLKSILDNIPSLIYVSEAAELKYLKANRPGAKYFGVSEQEIIGKTPYDFFDREEAESNVELDRSVFTDHQNVDIQKQVISPIKKEARTLHERKIPLYDPQGNPKFVLTIIDDVTDQVDLHNELTTQLERMTAVSQLSTGLQKVQTLEELYPTLLEIMLQILHARMGIIWIYKREKDALVPVYSLRENREFPNSLIEPLKPGKGIPGMVFSTRKPHFSMNYKADPYLSEHKREDLPNNLGGITMPLRTTNSVIGVINVSFDSERVISEEDIQILTTLCEIAGNAIQNINLKEETENHLLRLSALSSIDRAITSNLDLQISLEMVINNVLTQLKVDAADILLFNPHSQMLEFGTGKGFNTNITYNASLRLGESYAGLAAVTQQLVRVTNIEESNNRLFDVLKEAENIQSYFGIPLIAKGQLKGVLEVYNRFPFEPDDDWINYFKALAEQVSIAIENSQLFENLQRSNTELSMAYNATIEGWSRALDLRDKETEGHTLRVTELTLQLAGALNIPGNQIKYIRWGALLHDIGKMGVPDNILLKPGPLTDEEWVIMRLHPKYAFEMLSPIGYLKSAVDIPYCHHEKWDGTGYPRGLKGDLIPLSARIFAVVDIWDALRSDRPYRKAWPKEKVIQHIRSLSGNHLDPEVVKLCEESGVFQESPD